MNADSAPGAGGAGVGPAGGDSWIDYLESLAVFGMRPGLERVEALLERLGRPQDAYRVVHVVGTNGKSSTTRALAAILSAHGVKTGTYTSPELISMTERIEIDCAPVSEETFASGIAAALDGIDRLRAEGLIAEDAVVTQFELLTGAALWLFAEHEVEVACLEVGMGGRWDATSVVSPAVAVITGVALDHMEHLGTTRETIAEDKAHIIKPGSIAILGPGTEGVEQAFLARAEACDARVRAVRAAGAPSPVPDELTVRYEVTARPDRPGGSLALDVTGAYGAYRGLTLRAPSYQAANVATAVAAAEATLGRALDAEATRGALARLRFPGRFELVREAPPVVIDGAHNPDAAHVLADAIREAWPDPAHRPAVLLGILADKDVGGILEALAHVASQFACTQSASLRALDADALARMVHELTGERPLVFGSVGEALDALIPDSSDGIVATGSITTAGEARRHLLES